jgi:predicted kinase
MKTVWILKGLPASGKSTFAKELLSKHPGAYKRINRDDLRAMLDASHHSKENERFALQVRDLLIVAALRNGKHVIVDDTNLNPQHEPHIRNLVHEYRRETGDEVSVRVKFFEVSLEEAIARDLKRPRPVGERVIRQIYEKYLAPPVVPLQQDETLPKAILVDIDGTIAERGQRSPFDWERVHLDTPKGHVVQLVKGLHRAGYRIIFLSGRDEVCRDMTKEWIAQHFAWREPDDYLLLMRGHRDQRKDSIIKRELFDGHVRGRFYVEAVIDDRNQVVDMWRRELGLTCLQVDYGDF